MFTRCKHEEHGGEADLATGALDHWAALGWRPVTDTPKRGRKAADQSAGATTKEKE